MKAVVITGVTSGLGEALFRLLSEKPVKLYCISRKILPYQEEIQRHYKNIKLKVCDFSQTVNGVAGVDLDEVLPEGECEEIIFINNAGMVEPIQRIGFLSPESILRATHVNFLAPAILCDRLFRLSKSVGSKFRVINISTGAALHPVAGWPMYCATKAGYRMFIEVLREQCKGDPDVSVFHVDPGVMDTNMQKEIRMHGGGEMPDHEYFLELEKERKLLQPIDVARSILADFIES